MNSLNVRKWTAVRAVNYIVGTIGLLVLGLLLTYALGMIIAMSLGIFEPFATDKPLYETKTLVILYKTTLLGSVLPICVGSLYLAAWITDRWLKYLRERKRFWSQFSSEHHLGTTQ